MSVQPQNFLQSSYYNLSKNISFKFQLPPSNPRPELGLHRFSAPFSTDHQYQQTVKNTGKFNSNSRSQLILLKLHKTLVKLFFSFSKYFYSTPALE